MSRTTDTARTDMTRTGEPTRAGVPSFAAVQRCGGAQCPPGTCDHTDDPADAVFRSPDESAEAAGEAVPGAVRRVLDTAGTPLSASTRDGMESRFGHDFGQVRVHSDTQAAESARLIQAQAYTFGSHIVMGAGRYQPGTPGGDRLLTHELTHVVQQSGAPATATPTAISNPADAAERQADAEAGG
jgi:hypothetical protein